MLARVAENVYWLARYLERAENTARLISVNTNLLLDLPAGYAPGWEPLVDISGGRELFAQQQKRPTEREIVHFLIADQDNPGSIYSSLRSARENARSLRDSFPAEAWELLNQFFLDLAEDFAAGLNKRNRFDFLKRIVLSLQTLTGSLEGTLNRNDAYTFLMLGRNLERADMTSRIVDVRAAQLPAETAELRPFDSLQWMSVLKSLSGYQMYRLARRTRISRGDVLEFALRDAQFPRACLFCLQQVVFALRALPRSEQVLKTLGDVCVFLEDADLAALDQAGLHQLTDHLQIHIIRVHDDIAGIYFPGHVAPTADRGRMVAKAERVPISPEAACVT